MHSTQEPHTPTIIIATKTLTSTNPFNRHTNLINDKPMENLFFLNSMFDSNIEHIPEFGRKNKRHPYENRVKKSNVVDDHEEDSG